MLITAAIALEYIPQLISLAANSRENEGRYSCCLQKRTSQLHHNRSGSEKIFMNKKEILRLARHCKVQAVQRTS